MEFLRFDLSRHVHPYIRVTAVFLLICATVILLSSHVQSSRTSENTELTQRLANLEDQQMTLDLATEFGFDPLVVAVVRQSAKEEFLKRYCSCSTWRFIRSDKELAYTLLNIIAIESNGDIRAFNPGGPAYGLTQLVLSTARMYRRDVTPEELRTLPVNLKIATAHFVDLLERYHGNPILPVIAWNRGAGAVDRSLAIGESVDNGYAKIIFTRAALRNATD